MPVIWAVLSFVMAVGSAAYQYTQSVKAQKKAAQAAEEARAAEDRRRGFEIVVEGEIKSLPIVYGRAKVGGVRVFHSTKSEFIDVTHNGDTTPFWIGSFFNTPVKKNSILLFQQVLSKREVSAIYDAVIDDTRLLSDPTLGIFTSASHPEGPNNNLPADSGAMRIDLHYGKVPEEHSSSTSCAMMSANDSSRANARFTGSAFVSAAIKLDRRDPQFSAVPNIAFFVEGCKIFSFINIPATSLVNGVTYQIYSMGTTTPAQWISSGAKFGRIGESFIANSTACYGTGTVDGLSGNRTYSNNSARVLFDYLYTEKKIPLRNLDITSFKKASLICDTIVKPSTNSLGTAKVGGQVWQPIDTNRRNVTERDLPLYETNIIIDTEKTFRENIELLKETMSGSHLVWSQGKYKLQLQYPETDNDIIYVDTVNDDRLILSEDIGINYPSADVRLNHCTVRFANESENFKEDTVSWPPKKSCNIEKGIGGTRYMPVSGWDDSLAGMFINNYGVWKDDIGTQMFTWKIKPIETGTYTLNFALDTTGTISINNISGTVEVPLAASESEYGVPIFWKNLSMESSNVLKSLQVTLTAHNEYTITSTVNASNISRAACAANLLAPSGIQIWNTRYPSYTDFITQIITEEDLLVGYKHFLTLDNNIKLESDISFESCTDYYHALAKAEETVRTSRSANQYKFSYHMSNGDNDIIIPEPGDILKLQISQGTLNWDPAQQDNYGFGVNVFVKVESIKPVEGGILNVEGFKFYSEQLAWNVQDDYFPEPPLNHNGALSAPMYLEWNPGNSTVKDSPGTLNWLYSSDKRVIEYCLYRETSIDIWIEMGKTNSNSFDVPNLIADTGRFGIRSASKTGALSTMTISDSITLTLTNLEKPSNLLWTNANLYSKGSGTFSWDAPTSSGVIGYEVSWKLHFDNIWNSLPLVTTLSVDIPNIWEGTYDFRAKAKYKSELYSDLVYLFNQVVVLDSVPNVEGLIVSNSTDNYNFLGGSVKFSWTDCMAAIKKDESVQGVVTWFDSYEVSVYSVSDTNVETFRFTTNVKTNYFEVSLQSNILYSVGRRVRVKVSIKGSSIGSLSSTAAIATAYNAPPTMLGITPSVFSSNKSIDVNWVLWTSDDYVGVNIYCDKLDPPTTLINSVTTSKGYSILVQDIDVYHIKLIPYDSFGEGIGSSIASATTSLLSSIDIQKELTSSILITDSDTSIEALVTESRLLPLYDRIISGTGVSYIGNKWIRYDFGLLDYIDKVILHLETNGCQCYIRYSDDGVTWSYLGTNNNDQLDADFQLTSSGNTIPTHFWTVTVGSNIAIFPNRVVAKICELVLMTGANEVKVCELIFARIVIAEEIAANSISAYNLTADAIKSDGYPSALVGYSLNKNTGEVILKGMQLTVSNISGLPSSLQELSASDYADLQALKGLTVNEGETKIDGGKLSAGSVITVGPSAALQGNKQIVIDGLNGDLYLKMFQDTVWERYDSLTQTIVGDCVANETKFIDIKFRRMPSIMLSPKTLKSYNANHPGQSQDFSLYAESITFDSTTGLVTFMPHCQLQISDGTISAPLLSSFPGSSYTQNGDLGIGSLQTSGTSLRGGIYTGGETCVQGTIYAQLVCASPISGALESGVKEISLSVTVAALGANNLFTNFYVYVYIYIRLEVYYAGAWHSGGYFQTSYFRFPNSYPIILTASGTDITNVRLVTVWRSAIDSSGYLESADHIQPGVTITPNSMLQTLNGFPDVVTGIAQFIAIA